MAWSDHFFNLLPTMYKNPSVKMQFKPKDVLVVLIPENLVQKRNIHVYIQNCKIKLRWHSLFNGSKLAYQSINQLKCSI